MLIYNELFRRKYSYTIKIVEKKMDKSYEKWIDRLPVNRQAVAEIL